MSSKLFPEYEISDKQMSLIIEKPYHVHSVYYNKPPAVPFGAFQLVYMITKITQISIFGCRAVKVLVSMKGLVSSRCPTAVTRQNNVHVRNILHRMTTKIATFLDRLRVVS